MREVADLADVAISSVSRVLSGHPDVSAQMRDRVLSAVAQLEYEPDFLAQSLRRGQTLSVGFVLADISNPLMADIVLGAEAVMRSAGYSLLLMNSENDPALDATHIRFFQSRRVDGMILSLASETDAATLDLIAQVDGPVVVVDRELPAVLRGQCGCQRPSAAAWRPPSTTSSTWGIGASRSSPGLLAQLPGRERMAAMRAVLARRPEQVEAIYLPGSFSDGAWCGSRTAGPGRGSPTHGHHRGRQPVAHRLPPGAPRAGRCASLGISRWSPATTCP